jgi:hypothetical protein
MASNVSIGRPPGLAAVFSISGGTAPIRSRRARGATPAAASATQFEGATMKLEILIDDDETRALWETAKKAKAEVESWPAWKHNEVPRASSDASAPDAVARSTEGRR